MKKDRKKPPSQRESHWSGELGVVLNEMNDRLMAVSKGGMSVPQMKQALLNSARMALGDVDDLTLIRAERDQVTTGAISVRGDRALAGMMRQVLKDSVSDWRRAIRPEEILRFVERSFDLLFGDSAEARNYAMLKMHYAAVRLAMSVHDGAEGDARDNVPLLLYRVIDRAEKGLGDEANSAFFKVVDIEDELGNVEPVECIEDCYQIRTACGQTDYRDPTYRRELLDLITGAADVQLVDLHNSRPDVVSGAVPRAKAGNLAASMRVGEDYRAKVAAIKAEFKVEVEGSLSRTLNDRDRVVGFIARLKADRKALLQAASGAPADDETERKILEALDTSAANLMEVEGLLATVSTSIAEAVLNLNDVTAPPTGKEWTANSHTVASYVIGSKRIELSPDWSKSLTPPPDVKALASCVFVEITAA